MGDLLLAAFLPVQEVNLIDVLSYALLMQPGPVVAVVVAVTLVTPLTRLLLPQNALINKNYLVLLS
jgi:hypothetical protein